MKLNRNLIEIMGMAVDARLRWAEDGHPVGGDRIAGAYEHSFEVLAPDIHPEMDEDKLWDIYMNAAEKDLGVVTTEDIYG